MERHLLKIQSHHILVTVSQHADMIQGNPGTFQGNRKPVWQQLRHSSKSDMSGWTVITPHLDTGTNREQVFSPFGPQVLGCVRAGLHVCACDLCVSLHVCLLVGGGGVVCVYAHMFAWVDELHLCTCVFVAVCGLCLSLCRLASVSVTVSTSSWGRGCHIHHCYACCPVPLCQCVFALSHVVHGLL